MSRPVLIRLPERAGVDVTGSERVRWLDGMATQEVASASPGDSAPTLILTHQGRIVSDAWLWVFEDRIRLDLERAAARPVIEHLDRLIIADDVGLSDVSEAGARLTIEGQGARAAVEAATGAPIEAVATASLAGVDVVLAPHALVEDEGVQLLVPADAADSVANALLESGALAEGTVDALETRRIERAVPSYGKELDSSVLPAEARLDRAISTTKGCYAGQEVVARMRSGGRVSSLLVALRFEADAPPAPGSEIRAGGKKVGELTSSVRSEALGAIGLGYVKAVHAEPGTRVEAGGAAAVVVEPVTG